MTKLSKTFHRIFSPSGKGVGEKGFTLIELLVVVGILGVLAGVVTLSVGQFINTGQTEAATTERHNMQTAVSAWMAANPGTDPQTIATGDLVGLYILDTPHGTYSWDTNGLVTQLTY